MIVAIVLSAGESSRMGSPKALLPLAGKTFIERIVACFKATKVGKIVVVLGHNAEQLRPQIEPLGVSVVVNPDYRRGQLSSLLTGLRTVETEPGVDGVLMHLVDQPLINPGAIDQMIDRFYESKKSIVIPTYKGKKGHPVLLSRSLFPELFQAPLDEGAKPVVRAHSDETLEVETGDEGFVIDIDTPEDYRRHVGGGHVDG
jgi:molybdenum cofactor cytidylyltransferase